LLLDVWREACRHIEIGETAGTIFPMLSEHVPLRQLVVLRLDAEHHRVSPAALAPALPAVDWRGAQGLFERDLQKLKAWVRRGEPVHVSTAERMSTAQRMSTSERMSTPKRLPSALAPLPWPELLGELLIVPLATGPAPTGLCVLVSEEGKHFVEKHRALLTALQEPLSVALENDRRVHELAALRGAAEADRRSLLTRLGRKDLGDTIVGQQSGLRQVMQRVELTARSDVPVLILGETGTGKELIARAIHNGSHRHSGPFIRVNCGAIPAELIDSQLFGHEKGSFTGAVDSREGWFQRADGGTLFLDEIGELPPDAQVRLLRVLQDGFIERVGGSELIHVDVRLVAATHRDLPSMVRENRFREDLWYRIAVFPVLLPPLRERKDDVPALAEHFAQRAAIRFGLAPVSPTPEDLRLLKAYHWPGNVRELGAVIDRAAILGDGKSLEIPAALGLSHAPPGSEASSGGAPITPGVHASGALILPLAEAMRQHIAAALRATRGKIEGPGGAAALLKINPHTLRARMRKLDLDWAGFRG
jgi:transcriptional regulator with GAF, ATPase, and Fis domain